MRSLTRKVQHGEFPVILSRSLVAASRCFFARKKISEMDVSSVYPNTRSPLAFWSSVLIEMDSNKARAISVHLFPIAGVLALRAWPKIFVAVVETISILVVNLFHAADKIVHESLFLTSVCRSFDAARRGIEFLGLLAPSNMPIPSHQGIVAVSADDSDLALGQRDVANSWVVRLNYRKALRCAFFGWSPERYYALRTRSGFPLLDAGTIRAVVVLAGVTFVRLISRLGSLFTQVHFSPPRETCGLTALFVS